MTKKKGTAGRALPIDLDLEGQLVRAEKAGKPLQVVFFLKHPRLGEQKPLSAEETEATARHVLQRAADETGEAPEDINVFRNLGSFVVRGSGRLVRKVLEQKEIQSAKANQTDPDSAAES